MNSSKGAAVLAEALPKVCKEWEARSRGHGHVREKTGTGLTVALAREAGTQARQVADAVGARLGWPVYDREILDMIGQRLGTPAHALESIDEKGSDPFHAFVRETLAGFATGNIISEDRYARCLIEILTALGQRGECVIVGRGAPQLLPAGSTLRVRVVAPRHQRIAALRQQFHFSQEEAEYRLDALDRERRLFVTRHLHKDPTEPGNYDLLLNLAWFTVEECVDLIVAGLRRLRGSEIHTEA